MSLTPGARLGPYEVLGSLGAGGMGEVYRARDARLDRDVAIKVLPQSFAANSVRLERFEREARAASALNHPHICTVHDIAEDDGRVFLVMERLEGSSLKDAVPPEGLPIERVRSRVALPPEVRPTGADPRLERF